MSVGIYSLYVDSEDAVSVYLDDEQYDDFPAKNFTGESQISTWQCPPLQILRRNGKLGDFIAWLPYAPLISQGARKVLGDLISPYVEFLPALKLKGIPYDVLNVIHLIDCLDLEKCKIVYSPESPSKIMSVMAFHFNASKVIDAPIFKVPQDTSRIFVTTAFVRSIMSHKITGVGVEDPSRRTYAGYLSAVEGLPVKKQSK